MALVLETEPPLASSPRQDTDPVTTQTTGGVTRLSTTDTNLGLFLQILTVLLVVLTTAYPFWFVWHYDFQAQCQHLYLRIMASACLQVSIMQHIIAIVSWYIDDYRYRGQTDMPTEPHLPADDERKGPPTPVSVRQIVDGDAMESFLSTFNEKGKDPENEKLVEDLESQEQRDTPPEKREYAYGSGSGLARVIALPPYVALIVALAYATGLMKLCPRDCCLPA